MHLIKYNTIRLPVSILTHQSSSASHFAWSYQISYESDHRRRSYNVIKFFKMAAVDGLVVRMSSEGQDL